METTYKIERYGIAELQRRFPNEQSCIEYLEEIRWNGIPQCPRCSNTYMNTYLVSKERYKCRSCKYQFNVLSNSIFQSTKIDLRKWFLAIYFFITHKRGISSCQMARWIGTTQPNAWHITMKLREVLKDDKNKILTGIVEADEKYFSANPGKDTRVAKAKKRHEKEQDELYGLSPKRKTRIRKELKAAGELEKLKAFNEEQLKLSKNGKRTPFNPATAILGLYQRNGDLILVHLGRQYFDTKNERIVPLLKAHVNLNSVLITDESNFYEEIGKSYKDHKVVNHEREFVTKDGTHTNALENVWNHLMRMLVGSYFHVSFGQFYKYLNEQANRWNVRDLADKAKVDSFTPKVFGKKIRYIETLNTFKSVA